MSIGPFQFDLRSTSLPLSLDEFLVLLSKVKSEFRIKFKKELSRSESFYQENYIFV